MALAAAIVWEIRTTGAATNGGGFKKDASGTDWTQQDTAQYAVTDGVTNGSTTITSATASFGTDVVGNLIYVSGGTGSVAAGWYEITSRTNATTIVVDRSTGLTAGTGVTLNIGGAIDSIETLPDIGVADNTYWIKSGTYTIGSAVNIKGGSVGTKTRIYGYTTTRGDESTRPILRTSGATACLTTRTTSTGEREFIFCNIDFDGNSAGTTAIGNSTTSGGALWYFRRCTVRNFTGTAGLVAPFGAILDECTVVGNAGIGVSATTIGLDVRNSLVADNTGNGLSFTASASSIVARGSVFARNNHGIACRSISAGNCAFVDNAGDGINPSTNAAVTGQFPHLVNNIFYGNGGYGIGMQSSQANLLSNIGTVRNNAFGSNTSGNYNATITSYGDVTLTADPFTAKASDDYSLNSTAGGGAACKELGYPSAFPVP
jgi:hypothetical protein